MKYFLFVMTTLISLSACTIGTPGVSVGVGLGTSIGNNLGLGTSINIPVGFSNHKNNQPDNINTSGLNVIEEQIITYFDAKGAPLNQSITGGFYRQLIRKQGDEYIVQDFYGDNHQKRTDPYALTRNQLLDFHAHPINGNLTTYAFNGNLMSVQVYQNNRLIRAQY